MLTTSDHMAAAVEKHADLILKASGSALRHYTMEKTRAAILMAVMDCYEEAYRAGVVRVEAPAQTGADHG